MALPELPTFECAGIENPATATMLAVSALDATRRDGLAVLRGLTTPDTALQLAASTDIDDLYRPPSRTTINDNLWLPQENAVVCALLAEMTTRDASPTHQHIAAFRIDGDQNVAIRNGTKPHVDIYSFMAQYPEKFSLLWNLSHGARIYLHDPLAYRRGLKPQDCPVIAGSAYWAGDAVLVRQQQELFTITDEYSDYAPHSSTVLTVDEQRDEYPYRYMLAIDHMVKAE